jgi:glutathione S-transferase
MKLYTYPNAPNPRRVHLYLAEKGLELPCEVVDIMARKNRTPEFLARVNPLGGVPVLELDDGSHLAESVAICRYLEVLHPEPPLFGRSAEEVGRIEMWSRRIELNLMRPVGMVWVHGSPLTKAVFPDQIASVAEQSRVHVHDFYRFLDRSLAAQPFVAGDAFSMADILALATLDFAVGLVELPFDPGLTELASWHARVSGRASAKAHPAAGLS